MIDKLDSDAEIVQLKEEVTRLRNRLERISNTLFEPGEELVWFDVGEVNTMGAHTHISGPRNYFIHQADGLGSEQLFTLSVTTRRHRPLPSSATISQTGKQQKL